MTTTPDDEELDGASTHYPPADMTPTEFEHYVADFLTAEFAPIQNRVVAWHESIDGTDGSYIFDATVRFNVGEAAFLVLAEAKQHKDPIKRATVQILHSKLLGVGGHKGVVISTAPFQSGAIDFAKTHGIALVRVTEGRFTYEVKSSTPVPYMTREEAWERLELPTFVGVWLERGDEAGSTISGTIDHLTNGQFIAERVLGIPPI